MALLQANSFAEIRAAIDLSLDAAALPDDIIALDLFAGGAEAEIVARDPLATTYTVDDAAYTRVLRALHYLTAARLCPALPAITSEKLGADSYNRTAFDAGKRAAELRGLANQELAAYLEADGLTVPLFAFGTVPGYRGR